MLPTIPCGHRGSPRFPGVSGNPAPELLQRDPRTEPHRRKLPPPLVHRTRYHRLLPVEEGKNRFVAFIRQAVTTFSGSSPRSPGPSSTTGVVSTRRRPLLPSELHLTQFEPGAPARTSARRPGHSWHSRRPHRPRCHSTPQSSTVTFAQRVTPLPVQPRRLGTSVRVDAALAAPRDLRRLPRAHRRRRPRPRRVRGALSRRA